MKRRGWGLEGADEKVAPLARGAPSSSSRITTPPHFVFSRHFLYNVLVGIFLSPVLTILLASYSVCCAKSVIVCVVCVSREGITLICISWILWSNRENWSTRSQRIWLHRKKKRSDWSTGWTSVTKLQVCNKCRVEKPSSDYHREENAHDKWSLKSWTGRRSISNLHLKLEFLSTEFHKAETIDDWVDEKLQMARFLRSKTLMAIKWNDAGGVVRGWIADWRTQCCCSIIQTRKWNFAETETSAMPSRIWSEKWEREKVVLKCWKLDFREEKREAGEQESSGLGGAVHNSAGSKKIDWIRSRGCGEVSEVSRGSIKIFRTRFSAEKVRLWSEVIASDWS